MVMDLMVRPRLAGRELNRRSWWEARADLSVRQRTDLQARESISADAASAATSPSKVRFRAGLDDFGQTDPGANFRLNACMLSMSSRLPATARCEWLAVQARSALFQKEPDMGPDSELQHEARLELVRALGADAERIELRVRDGVAILTGSVRSEAHSWNAADAVRRVRGVQRVSNETMIAREASVLPTDAQGDVARPWFPSG